MTHELRPSADGPGLTRQPTAPVTGLDDPRAVQILTAEHGSLLSARSLAYNEVFARTGNFLAFLSMSFVGLALVAQVLPGTRELLLLAAIILAFDVVVGLATFGRTIAAGYEDYRAVQGMTRIRHGYGEVAPVVLPYFVDSRHDDLRGVMVAYGSPPTRGVGAVVYNLTTSAGTIVLIDAMLAAVFALVVVLILEGSLALGAITAVLVGLLTLVLLAFATFSYYRRVQASIAVVFPMAGDDAREEAPRNPSAGGSVDA